MIERLHAKSCWKTGQVVYGEYCGVEFTGRLTDECRPTPDYRNVIFVAELDEPITIFGNETTTVEVWTNHGTNYIIAQ